MEIKLKENSNLIIKNHNGDALCSVDEATGVINGGGIDVSSLPTIADIENPTQAELEVCFCKAFKLDHNDGTFDIFIPSYIDEQTNRKCCYYFNFYGFDEGAISIDMNFCRIEFNKNTEEYTLERHDYSLATLIQETSRTKLYQHKIVIQSGTSPYPWQTSITLILASSTQITIPGSNAANNKELAYALANAIVVLEASVPSTSGGVDHAMRPILITKETSAYIHDIEVRWYSYTSYPNSSVVENIKNLPVYSAHITSLTDTVTEL